VIGRTLSHYTILEKIGSGGMGDVYRARDESLGREVALKVLPPAAAADPERRQRFEREARAVASLQHPNIVTIHSVEEAEGVSFLTMELVRGRTLGEIIPAAGLPLTRVFEIGVPLADAVHAAHERAVIHRDLKPGNVMIDEAGRVKVLDFGLAKLAVPSADATDVQTVAAGSATGEGRILGTVAYMSPEQAEGKELDRRSDIFSLGVVLYEAATGKRPFQGDTPISTMSAILRDNPPSVTSLKPLPRHLGRVIHRCLEKNPDKRFQTARDVANELEGLKREVESGEVESVSSVSGIGMAPAVPPRPRRRAWIAVTAAVAAVAAVAVFVTVSRRVPTTPVSPAALRVRPLTGAVGVEYVGSWSPDGSFFTYSHSANGPLDIFIQSTAGGDPVRLVESPWDDWMPAWSPDNRWIAFGSNRDGRTAIYLVPPLGGALRHLTDLGFDPLRDGMPPFGPLPWSPDGERIVFARMQEGETSLWTVDLASGQETRLTRPVDAVDGLAVWSFDGRNIAFLRVTLGKPSLWIVPAGGGEERRVFQGEDEQIGSVGWSPDSRSIVFISDRESGTSNLWSVDVGSGALRQITSGTTAIDGQCVGRDGRILVNDFSHQTDLYLQPVDGGEAQRLTFHTRSNFDAHVSPRGDRIAYESDRTGNAEIWVLDLASGKELQLTEQEGFDGAPCWSPDGKTIAFQSARSGAARVWAVDAVGGAARQLIDRDDASMPRWSPDGSKIAFLSMTDGVQSLWLADPDGSRPSSVTANVSDFVWYRDGRHVIYTPANTGNTQIRALDLETGRDELIHDEPHVELAVAPDGRGITYCAARSHFNMNLRLLRLEEGDDGLPRAIGDPVALTAGDGQWHVHNGDWLPDGTTVVYTRDTDTANVFLIEGAFPGGGS